MHRPGCPGCRLNRRASEVADSLCTYASIFFMAFVGVQLWLIYRVRKVLPDTDDCSEHRKG